MFWLGNRTVNYLVHMGHKKQYAGIEYIIILKKSTCDPLKYTMDSFFSFFLATNIFHRGPYKPLSRSNTVFHRGQYVPLS